MPGEPTLKRGHNNPHEWVVYAQQMLNRALAGGMHLDVPENGVFDEAFEQEVRAFQSRHGLGQDGEIGPRTWAALHNAVAAPQHAASAAPAEEDDQLRSAPRETHSAPGHRDDEAFHQRTDAHGNTVRVYDMDAEVIGSPEWERAVSALIMMAEQYTDTQIPYVLVAVHEFQASSRERIDEFTRTAHEFLEQSQVRFPWSLLAEGLKFGISAAFEISEPIVDKLVDAFVDEIASELEAHADPVPNLEKRLEEGVATLTRHVTQQTVRAVDDVKAAIPDYIRDAMREYQQVSDNYEWLSAMAAYFGFLPRTEANVAQPILGHLNDKFEAMIQQVEQELLASG